MPKRASLFFSVLAGILLVSPDAWADNALWSQIIGAQKSGLSSDQVARVERILKREANTHGCKGSLSTCIAAGDLTARRHGGFVARMVKKGKDDAYIKKHIALRHRSAHPEEVFKIDVSKAPSKGKRNAPVQIVEYACFQCPFCAHLAPQLKKLEKRFGDKISFYFKYFPVISHKRGVAAAAAAVAADRQGKFWPMYDMLFANRANLEDDDLEAYAKKIGLDVARWKKDKADPATLKIIEQNKLEGMRYGVDGTPTFFINGKMFQSTHSYDELADRVAEELDILSGKIK